MPKNHGKTKKKSDPWTLGLGRGLAGDMGLNFLFFLFFPCFFLQFGLGGAGVQIVETRIFCEVLF
jgi:hypothetical protein